MVSASRLSCCFLLLLVIASPVAAEQAATVAGKTMEQYRAELDSDQRVVRLRAVRSLSAFGQSASAGLRAALDHDDAAVRYIAAVDLGRVGGDARKTGKSKLEALAKHDPSAAVKMAAAYALCADGQVDEHLPTLIAMLSYPERGTACSAAELIGAIGGEAEAAIEPLVRMHRENLPGGPGDYHLGGAAKNALRSIRGE